MRPTLLPFRFLSLALMLTSAECALALSADQVILKNGDHITGHVLTMTAETLSFATEAAGPISIRRDLIERLISDSDTLDPLVQSGRTTVPQTNSASCLQGAKPVPVNWSFGLQGTPNTVILGTQSQEQFGAGLGFDLCEGSRQNTTSITARGSHIRTYQEKSTSIQTDVASAAFEQQHFYHGPEGAAVYGVAEFFTNNSLGVAMQKSVGVGLLSPQFRHAMLFYDVSVDLRYLNQHRDHTSPALNLAALRWKEQAHVHGRLLAIDQQAWIMPALNDVHALQAYASVEPSLTIKPWLHVGLVEEESYLGNAPSPNRKNFFSSTLSLTFQGGSGSGVK